ncbi:MAG: phosphatase PAP2 family protein [Candidatus Beckwithbacteria bacterium]|nr:phosphatase PAP2 family protein [Candidatus Beckwithbacteria bacterium]
MFWIKIKRSESWLLLAGLFATALLTTIKLADNFIDKDGLILFDQPINLFIQHLRTPILNKLMLLISLTANWQMLLWGTLLASLLLLAAKKRRYLLTMLISNTSAWILVELTKLLTARPRPPVENALIVEHGFAFPSGHSYFAVVFYGLLTYFWVRHFQKKWEKISILILGSIFILLLAFSRIYLGVHWSTDVLAGLSTSTAWLTITIAYIEYKRRFFRQEHQSFNKKLVWQGFGIFMILWLTGLIWLYRNNINILGKNIIKPTTAAVSAITNTAPAAKSRTNLVAP